MRIIIYIRYYPVFRTYSKSIDFEICREMREEYHQLSNRENDSLAKRKDYEQKCATAESEITSLKNDLRLALQRIADLQQAMEEGDDDESSDR